MNVTARHESAPTNFWHTLPRPILGLAPMDGITDHPYRHIQKKYGRPTVIYTEFTSVVEALGRGSRMLKDFLYDESQRPIVAQIYGRQPDRFRQLAVVICQLGFDGIDINMGCPAPSVASGGSGAGLIRTPALAQEIIAATKAGVQDWLDGVTARECPQVPKAIAAQVELRHAQLPPAYRKRRPLPVSVKTRIGYEAPEVEAWIPCLLKCEPAAIGLHGRTLRQGYKGNACWDAIGQAAELARGSGIPILGNGDLQSFEDAHARSAAYGLEGVLIGRASYGNPFVFRPRHEWAPPGRTTAPVDPFALLRIALDHATLYEASFSRHNPNDFIRMRKHLAWYARHLPGATGLRRELVQTWNVAEVDAIMQRYLAYRQKWEKAGALAPPLHRSSYA